MESQAEKPEIMTSQEAAAALGISTTTLHRRVRDGLIPTVTPKPANLIRYHRLTFKRADIEAMLRAE